MTHGSLFSGIGGFDLAAEWSGWTNSFNCEIEPFARQILKHHFPYAQQYYDIRETDFSVWRDRIDVLSGGFPCQPFSTAGKRGGVHDERHLWPEMLRAIREIKPRWVVGENVLGIVNWQNGVVFEQVCTSLEAEGYEVAAYVLPAAGVSALHRRDRVWFVAYSHGLRLSSPTLDTATNECVKARSDQKIPTLAVALNDDFRSESHKHGIIDGIPKGLDERSIHGYGNAIVPQVAHQIFKSINLLTTITKS